MILIYFILFLTCVRISIGVTAIPNIFVNNDTDTSKSISMFKNWTKNDRHTENSSKSSTNQSKALHSKSSNNSTPDSSASKTLKVSLRSKHKNDTHQETNSNSLTNSTQRPTFIFHKIQHVVTRSKDAVWATLTLTFICVILVLAVAQSRMWKDRRYNYDSQGVPLPNFNERVLFKDVMERKMNTVKEFFLKKTTKEKNIELQSLLTEEWEED